MNPKKFGKLNNHKQEQWKAPMKNKLGARISISQNHLTKCLDHTHDFKSYQNLHMTMAGWFRDGQDPPVMEPPPSNEWLKCKT